MEVIGIVLVIDGPIVKGFRIHRLLRCRRIRLLQRSGYETKQSDGEAPIMLELWGMLRAVMKKSWKQHPTKQLLYGYLPPISKTIQVRRTRHARHCWRSKAELISNVLFRTPHHGRANVGRRAKTYLQQLCADTECNLENLPKAMDYGDDWRERVREIRAWDMTWWWWYIKMDWSASEIGSLDFISSAANHPGWRLMRLGYRTCFYTLYEEKKWD